MENWLMKQLPDLKKCASFHPQQLTITLFDSVFSGTRQMYYAKVPLL